MPEPARSLDPEAAARQLLADGQALFPFGSSVCHVRLVGNPAVAIVRDLESAANPGPSVTNAVEKLGTTLRDLVGGGRPVPIYQEQERWARTGSAPEFCRVTFGDETTMSSPGWQVVGAENLERQLGTRVPQVRLTPEERGWINDRRAEMARADVEWTIRRRNQVDIRDVRGLPLTDVPLRSEAGKQNWAQIARVSCACHLSGVDPLDVRAAHAFAEDAGLTGADLAGFDSLYTDPIAFGPTGFSNGRHRVQALRQAGVQQVVAREVQ